MSPIVPVHNDLPEDDDSIFNDDGPSIHQLNLNDSDGSNNDDETELNGLNGHNYPLYGYEPLLQDPNDLETATFHHYSVIIPFEDNFDAPAFPNSSILEEIQPSFTDNAPVQLSERDEEKSQPMDEEHIEKIKAAMAGFTLPSTSIPPWATEVPEEQWKAHLISDITTKS